MKNKETLVGPCSKFVDGQGWTTEIPVEMLKEKGYVKADELQTQVDELTKPIGKFKDQTVLKKAYESLEKEFTRKIQQLKELKERCEIAEGTKNRLTIFDRIEIHDKAVKDTAREIWEDCIDEIMRGCGDDKEFWVMKILIETFKKYGVGFEVE